MKISTSASIIIVLIILLVAAGVYYFSSKQDIVPIRDRDPIVSDENVSSDIIWDFDMRDPVDPMVLDAPTTRVSVTIGVKRYEVGTYLGSCSEIDVEEEDMTLLSSVRCWSAGRGDDIGVFEASGKKVIKHRILEEGNSEPGSSFIGEFETIVSI